MHALASSLLKTGRYRDTIAPDDLDTCIKIIRSARRHNATSQFSVRLLHKSQEPGGRSAKTLQHWLQTGRRDGDGPSRRCARRESTVLQGSSRPGVSLPTLPNLLRTHAAAASLQAGMHPALSMARTVAAASRGGARHSASLPCAQCTNREAHWGHPPPRALTPCGA